MEIKLNKKQKIYFSEIMNNTGELDIIDSTDGELEKEFTDEYYALKNNNLPPKHFFVIVNKSRLENDILDTVGYFVITKSATDRFNATIVIHDITFVNIAYGHYNSDAITKLFYYWASTKKEFNNIRSISIHYPIAELDNAKIFPRSSIPTKSIVLKYEEMDYYDRDLQNFDREKRDQLTNIFEMRSVTVETIDNMDDRTYASFYKLSRQLKPFDALPKWENLVAMIADNDSDYEIKSKQLRIPLILLYRSILSDKTNNALMLFSKVDSDLVGIVLYKLTENDFKLIDVTVGYFRPTDIIPVIVNNIVDELHYQSCSNYYADVSPEDIPNFARTGFKPKNVVMQQPLRGVLK